MNCIYSPSPSHSFGHDYEGRVLKVFNIIEFAKMLSCSLIRLKDAGRIGAVRVDHNFGEGLKEDITIASVKIIVYV